jgi:hypothetical protein
MARLQARTAQAIHPPDAGWLCGQIVAELLIGANRYRRGERLSARARMQAAAGYLAQLLSRPATRDGARDSLDPLRRFEQIDAEAAAALDAALALPPPAGAIGMLALARRIPEFPGEAAASLEAHLASL